MLIGDQIYEFGWRYNPAEARNEHGEWTHQSGEILRQGGEAYRDPDTHRLDSTRSPYAHPSDHPFFQEHPVSPENVMAVYDRTPEPLRQQGMRWYADAHSVAKAIAHGDAEKGAGVLSAYSPQTAWPVNMFNANRAMELGRAIGPGEGMITGSMQANAQKAIDGQTVEQALRSSKTRAFGRLIRNGGDMPADPQGDVVIDRHAMSVAMGQRLPKSEADKAPIDKPRFYDYVADQYREAARRLSERDGTEISPHQLQAITWLQQQEENDHGEAGQMAGDTGAARRQTGRETMVRNAWRKWNAKAKADEIPTYPGTTMLETAHQTDGGGLTLAAWQHEMRGPHGEWVRGGEPSAPGEQLRGHRLVDRLLGPSSGVSEDTAQSVYGFLKKTAPAVPEMFGPGEHLDYDGKPPNIYRQGTNPGVLAEIDWNGHMHMADGVAAGLADVTDHPDRLILVPGSLTVPLHEFIHSVLPAGERRATNGDQAAYQGSLQRANIEEGFTELGSVQHAGEYFRANSLADRQVDAVNQGVTDQMADDVYQSSINYSVDGLSGAEAALRGGDVASARKYLSYAKSNVDPDSPIGPALLPEIEKWDAQLARAGQPAGTMAQMAEDLASPENIKAGTSWGRYRDLTAQAYNWTSIIAQQHTGKSEEDPATQAEIRRLADEVNAVGTAAKPGVMARHAVADMLDGSSTDAAIIESAQNSILSSWGTDMNTVIAQVRQQARQKLQELQAERGAA